MAKIKRGFLTYDTRRNRLSVSWRETLSLVGSGIRLRQLGEVKDKVKGRLLDVGCGVKPYSLLFWPPAEEYIGIDLPSTLHGVSQIDVYGDASALPFQSGSFDTVLCTEVLEHVSEPQEVVNELWRVLKVNGYLLLTTPQNYWVHEAPHDFYRFTRYGLAHLMEKGGFQVCSITPTGGASPYLVDSWSKICIILVSGLGLLLGGVFHRSRINLLAHPFVRLSMAFPQWIFLAWYLWVRSLAKRYNRTAFMMKLLDFGSERFTLGHVVVAIKS